jgi:hypothetical protein
MCATLEALILQNYFAGKSIGCEISANCRIGYYSRDRPLTLETLGAGL